MPIPAAAAIAAANLAGSAGNSIGQVLTNRGNRKFAREMYDRQKSDNIEFWNMQNEYNSPAAQMRRFQEAGLNKNLIYGQGNTAGAISTPDVQQGQSRNPEFGNIASEGIMGLLQYYDLKIKQAQHDNLLDQGTVIREDAMLRRAQTEATTVGAQRGKFNLDFENELRDVSADSRREHLRQVRTQTDLSINRDAREALSNSSNLQEALERMASMRIQRAHTRADVERIKSQVANANRDGILKDLEIKLNRKGITWSDALWQRMAALALTNILEEPDSPNNPIKLLEKLPQGNSKLMREPKF